MGVNSAMTKSEAIAAVMALLPVIRDQSVAMVGTDCENLSKIISDLQNAAQKLCPVLHDPCQPVEINPSDSGIDL